MTESRADDRVVLQRLATISRTVRHLRRHRGVTADELRVDLDLQWSVLHGLQIAIQAVLDVATHLATAEGEPVSSYAAAIDALGRRQRLEASFARRLRGIAGFRNVIVHDYLEVDLDIVAGALHAGLDDLEQFVRVIEASLAPASAPPPHPEQPGEPEG